MDNTKGRNQLVRLLAAIFAAMAFLIIVQNLRLPVYAEDTNIAYQTAEEALADGFTVTLSNDVYTLTGYSGDDEVVAIPSTVDGKAVTTVASKAFNENTTMETIIIPSSVKEMQGSALYKCTALKSVEIYGNCVNKYITYKWANGCGVLDSIYLGKNVTLYREEDNRIPTKGYFVDPDNASYYVKDGAVYKKNTQKLLMYPTHSDATNFGAELTSVESYAFYGNKNLETVNLAFDGSETNSCGYKAFSYCAALKTLTVQGVGGFNANCIEDFSALESLLITGNGSANVYLCDLDDLKLEEVIIGDGVTSIDTDSYNSSTTNYQKLVIGKDVEPTVLSDSYSDPYRGLRSNVKQLEVDGANQSFTMNGAALCSKDGKTLYAYNSFMNPQMTYVVPEGTKQIYGHAFFDVDNIYVINLPEGLESIGDYAFYNMDNLVYIYIPESVTDIGDQIVASDVTIFAKPGTEAEDYASAEGIPFISSTKMEETVGTETYPSSTWSGSDTEEIIPVNNTYIIQNAEQLAWIAEANNNGSVDFTGKVVKLAADIDLSDKEWTPIGSDDYPFRGSFDGQNHTITGLTLTDKSNAGLFGRAVNKTGATKQYIKNIKFKRVDITNCSTVGALAGKAGVTSRGAEFEISNISVSGKTEGVSGIGGIVGTLSVGPPNSKVTVKKCTVKMNFAKSSGGTSGGIICNVSGFDTTKKTSSVTIQDCSYKGTMTGSGRYHSSAGIVKSVDDGNVQCLIKSCVARGRITAGNSTGIGGIITGVGRNVTLEACLNLAEVNGGYDSGGIASSNSGTIRKCENDGYVNLGGFMANNGGIVGGNSGTIEDCVNLGDVEASYYSGGIAGNNSGTIIRCYNAGEADGTIQAIKNIGGLSGYQTGTVDYSYANDLSASSLYGKGGFVDTPTSRMLTVAQMMAEASFETWDFVDVWEFDGQYCYGFPVLRDIKPLLPKHPSKGTDSASKTKAQFFAVDQDGEPVEDAEITFGTEGNSVSGTTDKYGSVILKIGNDRVGIKATKEGFADYSNPNFKLPRTHEYTIRMVDRSKSDPFDLNSVLMTYNTNVYEMLAEEVELNKKYKSNTASFSCTLVEPDAFVDHYELIQPDVRDDPIATSDDGTFKDIPLTSFEVTKYKKKVRNIYIRVVDSHNEIHDTKINLNIINAETKELSSLSFGDGIKIHIDNGDNVLGIHDIEIPFVEFPFHVTVSEDSWEVCANVSPGFSKDEAGKKEFYLSKIEGPGATYDDYKKACEKLHAGNPKDIIKNPNVKVQVIGYASGDLPIAKSDFDFKVYVGVSIGASWEFPVECFVIAIDLKGTVYADGTVTLKYYSQDDEGRPGVDLYEGYDWVGRKFDLGVKGDGTFFGGIGVPKIVSIGAYGHAQVKFEWEIFTEQAGFTELSVTGDAGAAVRVAGKQAASIKIVEAPSPLYLYKKDTDVDRKLAAQKPPLKAQLKAASDLAPDTISRDSFTSIMTGWTGNNSSAEVLRDNAYPDIMPQIVRCGDKTIMFLLDDGDSSRPTDDKSMLLYSVRTDGVWSDPEPVWDDGTADFSFSAYSDGNKVYVAWNNAKGALASGLSLAESGKLTEIAFAEFNGTAFTGCENLTNNNDFETQPKITGIGDVPYICWSVNSENDVFGVSGTNSVYFADKTGSWHVSKVADFTGLITNESFGSIGGSPYYAYILATDDGYYNPHLVSASGSDVRLSENDAVNIGFDAGKVFWTDASGSINTADAGGTGTGGELAVPGTIKQIISDGSDRKAYIYIRSSENTADAFMKLYDPASGTWSSEIAISNAGTNNYVESVSGVFENGSLVLTYNQRTVDISTGDYNGTNSLRQKVIDLDETHVAVTGAEHDVFAVEAGADLPVSVTVKNAGSKTVNRVHFTVKNNKKNEAGETVEEVLYDQTADLQLAGGSSEQHEIVLALPEDFVKSDLVITATDADTETVYSDSKYTHTVGQALLWTDLKKYCTNDKYTFALSVHNDGYSEASGTVEFYDLGTDEVIEAYAFRRLQPGDIEVIRTGLPQIDWRSLNYKEIGVRIVDTKSDVLLGNTSRSIVVSRPVEAAVEYVKISNHAVTLTTDEPQKQLTASVFPEDATNQTIFWKSEDPTVATVDENGLVTAVAGGVTRIYAYSEDGNKAISCTVTSELPKALKKLTMASEAVEVEQFRSTNISYNFKPADADLSDLKFTVGDTSIARITDDGTVYGIRAGETTATVSAGGMSASCKLTVEKSGYFSYTEVNEPSELTSDNVETEYMEFAYIANDPETRFIKLTFDEDTYLGYYGLRFITMEDRYFNYEYSELRGKTVILQGPYVVITFNKTSDSNRFGVTSIEEIKTDSVNISGGDISLLERDYAWLTCPIVVPGYDTDTVEWTSSDENVVTVSEEGRLEGQIPGNATVTAKLGNCTAVFNVTVEEDKSIVYTDNIDDLQHTGPLEEGLETITYIYGARNPDTKYMKVTFSPEYSFSNQYSYVAVETTNENRKWFNDFTEGSNSCLVKGNELTIHYWPEDGETGGFRVESVEELEDIDVESFEIEQDEMTIEEGDSERIYYSIEPYEYRDYVEFVSDNTDVVGVDSGRFIYGVEEGTANVSCTMGGITRTIRVTVTPAKPRTFEIEKENYQIVDGYIFPAIVCYDSETGISLDEGYDFEVYIDGTKVRVVGIYDYEGCTRTITVPIYKPVIKVKSISLSGISNKIAAGKKVALTAAVTPDNATNKAVTWKSSNTKFATVTAGGVVATKAKAKGKTVTITATANDGSGATAVYKIKIMKGVVKSVKAKGKKSLQVSAGKSAQLKTKVTATAGANKKLKWTSSNPYFASVSPKGKVTTKPAGKGKTVKITAMATDGSGKKVVFKIKIK